MNKTVYSVFTLTPTWFGMVLMAGCLIYTGLAVEQLTGLIDKTMHRIVLFFSVKTLKINMKDW